jgi:DnaJ-class molecular chaperone
MPGNKMPDPKTTSSGIDRRSALKTAAAAAAITWIAPVITSQSAHAQEVDVCTPKCLPVGSGTGTATASATCSGQGVRRRLNVEVDLSAFQSFSCPCGGEPTIGVTSCTSNFGTCSVGEGGQVSVSYFARGFTGVLDFVIQLTGTASCPDRSPDDGDCVATCTTTVSVRVFVQDRGNCNGFPQNPTATVTTTCN